MLASNPKKDYQKYKVFSWMSSVCLFRIKKEVPTADLGNLGLLEESLEDERMD
jgi:hypothetical protein